MEVMFWVWLGVIVVSAIAEAASMELVSVWFIVGAIPPFIMSAFIGNKVLWLQILLFVIISALLIIFVRKWAKKILLKNANEKTNVDAIVGKKLRMLSKTDFETIGSVKINDVVWSAIGENQQTIDKDAIVEVVKVAGNKLIVKAIEEKKEEQTVTENNSQKTAEVRKGGKK